MIDVFTEPSRVSSPGYGAKMSLFDVWRSSSMGVTSKSLERIRDDIRSKVQEPRMAYTTVCKSLYSYLHSLVPSSEGSILDIAAFGERAIAAHSLGMKYVGIDPDSTLAEGHSRILSVIDDPNITFRYVPLEAFSTKEMFDIMTISPPPFTCEKYSGGSHQAHSQYHSRDGFIQGFLNETIERAAGYVKIGGIFAFTCLDRPEFHYTSDYLRMASKRFAYVGAVAVGESTPWWIFRKEGELKVIPPPLDLSKNRRLMFEVACWYGVDYITSVISSTLDIRIEKLKRRLGRLFMSSLGFETSCSPIPDHIPIDCLEDFEADVNETYTPTTIQNQGLINERFTVMTASGSWCSLSEPGVEGLCREVNRVIRWLTTTSGFNKASSFIKVEGRRLVPLRNQELAVLPWIREGLFGVSLRDVKSDVLTLPVDVTPSSIRYDALDNWGHQFTRPEDRNRAIHECLGSDKPLVDAFASPANVGSIGTDLFGSLFPDVEEKSLGPFALWDPEKVKGMNIMINPPNTRTILESVLSKMEEFQEAMCVGGTFQGVLTSSSQLSGAYKKMTELKSFRCLYILDPKYDSVGPFRAGDRGTTSFGMVFGSDASVEKLGKKID